MRNYSLGCEKKHTNSRIASIKLCCLASAIRSSPFPHGNIRLNDASCGRQEGEARASKGGPGRAQRQV